MAPEYCHATTGPPGPFIAATAGPPGPFAALQMVPPDQLWRRGWSPFATAGPPLPQLVPRIIQHLLLFIEPYSHSNVKIESLFS